ncbi:MAG: hypothetical protein CVU05_04530 [Bacteroidetes bacterium HGW-Bacteroidetes-21]|jgi:UDP-GlcNAc:undecaprenyl-phosphate GlcNAc-1-phosphate transferase|nr:MAG: hypothetical protein CVU05_04530 [Bacteroidetes bacterium HGW-Bacteroidetes-21]
MFGNNNVLIVFIVSYAVALIIFWFLLKQSGKYSLRKANISAIRFRSQTKPVSGGIGLFIMTLFTGILFSYILNKNSGFSPHQVSIGFALIIAFFSGLLDDIINVSPLIKFISQVLIGIICIQSGIIIHITDIEMVNISFTILWIVGIMNSINMLDNMDAVTAVTSVGILLGIGGINVIMQSDAGDHYYISIILASLVAFLYFNWPTAKMYMGDNGSQFMGALLAIYSIIYIWNPSGEITGSFMGIKPFIVVFLAFLIPITDTFTVTVNRLLKGGSPFVGGRDHSTHFLFYRGLSEKSIAALFLFVSIGMNMIAMLLATGILGLSHPISIVSIILAVSYFLAAYINTRITKVP